MLTLFLSFAVLTGAMASSCCEWNAGEKKCDLSGMYASEAMKGSGGAMGELLAKTMACNGLGSSETCGANSDCAWEAGEKKCEVNGAVAAAAMMGGGGESLMTKTKACGALGTSEKCGTKSDCDWNADEKRCELNAGAMMGGGDSNGDMGDITHKKNACLARGQSSCTNPCDKDAIVGQSPKSKVQSPASGAWSQLNSVPLLPIFAASLAVLIQ